MLLKIHTIYSLCMGSLFSLLLTNCGTTQNAVSPTNKKIPFEESRLMGTPWRLDTYQENNSLKKVDTILEVTITFEKQKETPNEIRVYGRSACNRYFGSCTIQEKKLTIQPNMGMTRMMCAPKEMEMEDLYIKMLPKMTTIEFVENSKTKKIDLVLSNDKNEKLVFYPYNLE